MFHVHIRSKSWILKLLDIVLFICQLDSFAYCVQIFYSHLDFSNSFFFHYTQFLLYVSIMTLNTYKFRYFIFYCWIAAVIIMKYCTPLSRFIAWSIAFLDSINVIQSCLGKDSVSESEKLPNHFKIDIAFILLVFVFFEVLHWVTKHIFWASKAKPLKFICFLWKDHL